MSTELPETSTDDGTVAGSKVDWTLVSYLLTSRPKGRALAFSMSSTYIYSFVKLNKYQFPSVLCCGWFGNKSK